jgi:DNA replication ATP-dependent helicase Dna2
MATNNAYPISSNSRTKLNAFRFKEDEGVPHDATSKDETRSASGSKAFQEPGSNGETELMQTFCGKGNPPPHKVQEPEPQIQETRPIKECPQTPGNRIPLADLISNAEDSFDPATVAEVTPVEHVIWQHVPASPNPDTSSQTPAGRRRKRRHSSSPAGSPSKGNNKKGQKEPFDLHPIQALFKTPQHDMAAELWNNYMDKNMVDGAEGLPPPRLANLLSSSPQTPVSGRTSRDSSGLRRAISCTTEFPTSRTKRQRVNRLDAGGRGMFERTTSNVESGKPKSSRITYLMEKIEKSIHMAPADAGPPGSSPLRQHVDARRCRSSSPTKDRKLHEIAEKVADFPCGLPLEKGRIGQPPVLQESSSEFGDDDLDQDLMDLADVSGDPFTEPAHASNEFASLGSSGWAALTADKSRSCHPKEDSMLDGKPSLPPNNTNNEAKDDEFDDFDDYDDLPDNLQEILAKCDTQPNPADPSNQTSMGLNLQKTDATTASVNGSVHSKHPATATVKAEMGWSDDEFDGDFDLEAIEQTMKQAGEAGPAYVSHS